MAIHLPSWGQCFWIDVVRIPTTTATTTSPAAFTTLFSQIPSSKTLPIPRYTSNIISCLAVIGRPTVLSIRLIPCLKHYLRVRFNIIWHCRRITIVRSNQTLSNYSNHNICFPTADLKLSLIILILLFISHSYNVSYSHISSCTVDFYLVDVHHFFFLKEALFIRCIFLSMFSFSFCISFFLHLLLFSP